MGIIILLFITLLAGCGTNDNPVTVEDRIEEMLFDAYTCDCTATIVSDKTENKYTYSCNRMANGTYTVDYGDMTIAVDEYNAVISKDGNEIKTDISDNELALIPTYFFDEYLKSGKLIKNDNGYILESEISDDNPYRHTALMMLDENLVPHSMHIMDKNGNDVIGVEILEFSHTKGEGK